MGPRHSDGRPEVTASSRAPPEPVAGSGTVFGLSSSRCHCSTRASMSTMSHELAASRGLPQTAPGLAMQAPVPGQS